MSTDATVLFVDDEQHILSSLQRNLVREPYQCRFASSGREGLEILAREPVQVVVSDMRMPEMDGMVFLNEVRNRYPEIVRIVLSGTADFSKVLHAVNSGEVYRFMTKPLDEIEAFRATLRQALEYYALHKRQKDLLAELELQNHKLLRQQEKINYELRLAGQVQRRLLSTAPVVTPDYEIRFAYRPSLSVGGDFFDAVSLPDGRLCIYIGDVSGHGVAPALISTFLKVTATDLVYAHIDDGPAAICRALNRFILDHHLGDDIFATFFVGLFDPSSRRWRVCNCGHPEPIRVGSVGALCPGGGKAHGDVPLGILDGPGHFNVQSECGWHAGEADCLFVFTDGLYEARHRQTQALCGLDVLSQAAAELLAADTDGGGAAFDPEAILALLEARGYELAGDDCCAITVRLIPSASTGWRRTVACSLEAVDAASVEVETVLRQAGWSELSAGAVRLLFSEYAVNVVRHGYLPVGSLLPCCLQVFPDHCMVFVADAGVAWDMHGRMTRADGFCTDAERGRGLFIVREIAQAYDFFRWGAMNHARFRIGRDNEDRRCEHE